MTRSTVAACILASGIVAHGVAAFAQSPPSASPTSRSRDAVDVAPELAAGVYGIATRGTAPVRFELRTAGAQSIDVTPEADDASYATFSPGCTTPCTLWFERGRHFVRLGDSPLRTRIFELNVDTRPATLRFSRDAAVGVIAGVAIGVAGVIAMIIGAVEAVYTPASNAAAWWVTAGVGVAAFASGASIAFASFGSSEIEYPDGRDSRRIGPPIGQGATDR